MFMSSLMPFEFQFQQSHSQHKFFLDILLLPQPAWIKFIPSDTNWLHIFTCALPLLRLLCVHKIPLQKGGNLFDTFGAIVVVIVFAAIIGMDKRDGIKKIEFKGCLSDSLRYELFTLSTDMGAQKTIVSQQESGGWAEWRTIRLGQVLARGRAQRLSD